jgi:hypothetical protein
MAGGGSRGGGDAPVARVRLRAVPGADRTRVVGTYGEGWKVRIAAAPEQGRANAELCGFLAKLAGVPRGDVDVVTGSGSRDKLVEVRGVEFDVLRGLLDAASGK